MILMFNQNFKKTFLENENLELKIYKVYNNVQIF